MGSPARATSRGTDWRLYTAENIIRQRTHRDGAGRAGSTSADYDECNLSCLSYSTADLTRVSRSVSSLRNRSNRYAWAASALLPHRSKASCVNASMVTALTNVINSFPVFESRVPRLIWVLTAHAFKQISSLAIRSSTAMQVRLNTPPCSTVPMR